MYFSAVSTIVLIVMILGTGYDYYLSNIVAHKKNVIYDLEKHGKFDHLTNDNGKALNGKELHVLKSLCSRLIILIVIAKSHPLHSPLR